MNQTTYLGLDEKYTRVVWSEGEALIHTLARELMGQLDPQRFVQMHRSVRVNFARHQPCVARPE